VKISDENLTCGWLLSEVIRKYVAIVSEKKKQGIKITKKLIVALKTTQ
jgi:hypothetical protein